VEQGNTKADDAGRGSDPERGDQERPARTGGRPRVPEHGPQLHRALAAATADIDAVEDRLSTLFERTEGVPTPRLSRTAPARPPVPLRDDGDDIIELFEPGDVNVDEADDVTAAGAVTPHRELSDEEGTADGAFARLDADLAAETPDEPVATKRRLFRRRS
jgi:hypothetical protein